MGKLVNMSRKFTPRDYISKRTWFSTVLHVNSTRVVANDFNGVSYITFTWLIPLKVRSQPTRIGKSLDSHTRGYILAESRNL